MKSLNYILAGILLAMAATELPAQNAPYIFEGEVMQQANLSGEAAARLTQPQLYGTARSMAMANAFTSLGADMASLSINPAGLGMYRHNEFSLTPLVTTMNSTNSTASYGGNSKTRFALGNLGMVYNLYEGTGRVVSVNLGIGYNRIADLNYRTSLQYENPYDGKNKAPSILDVMVGQLTVNGLYPNSDGFLGYYGENYPDLWGAMMAYNSYLLNVYDDGWEADRLGANADVGHFYDLESRGSVGEYDLSFGMNIDNRFYVGATFGIQSLSQRIDIYYGEDYQYRGEPAVNSDGAELIEQADYMHYNQAASMSGVGVNFKLGLIYRPIEALRIGFAFHSPTFWSIDRSYAGQMAARLYNNDTKEYFYQDTNTDGSWTDSGSDSYRLTAPSRLMFGASYSFGSRAIVSVDYERDWYNGIRTTQYPFWVPDQSIYHRSAFKQKFCATNTLRIGAEFKPIERLSLRAGFSYTSSMVRNAALTESSPLPEQVLYYTAGIGFALSRRITLDLAYQYCQTTNSDYRLFYSVKLPENGPAEPIDRSKSLSTDYTRHNAALTLNVKF